MNENKKILSHSTLMWIIVVLFSLMLIVLVFKVGIMVGSLKSHFSSCGVSNYHKDFTSHLGGGFSNLIEHKKAKIEAFKEKAESTGMTLEEFKEYLIEQKEI